MTASADPSEKPWSFDPPLRVFLTWTAMARSLHSVSSWMWAMGEKEGSWAGFPSAAEALLKGLSAGPATTLPAGPSLKGHVGSLHRQPAPWIERIFRPSKIFWGSSAPARPVWLNTSRAVAHSQGLPGSAARSRLPTQALRPGGTAGSLQFPSHTSAKSSPWPGCPHPGLTW